MGRKALASCTEACLLVTNTFGKQCGLRMAYSCGEIITYSCQGHWGWGWGGLGQLPCNLDLQKELIWYTTCPELL